MIIYVYVCVCVPATFGFSHSITGPWLEARTLSQTTETSLGFEEDKTF